MSGQNQLQNKAEKVQAKVQCFWLWKLLVIDLEHVIMSGLYFELKGENRACVDGIVGEIDSKVRRCQCNVDCHELDFEISSSISTFPSAKYLVKRFASKSRISLTLITNRTRPRRLTATTRATVYWPSTFSSNRSTFTHYLKFQLTR